MAHLKRVTGGGVGATPGAARDHHADAVRRGARRRGRDVRDSRAGAVGRRSGRTIAVTVEPLTHLTKVRRRALDEQVSRVGEILEAGARLTIGPVTVGPHA
jgi:hypothetical protein